MEQALERQNMLRALGRVERNGGAPGGDGMRIEELRPLLRTHWARIREELLSTRYQPQPVRRVEIPKPGGGMRQLGIPAVLDRLIQQALLHVLTPIFDPHFSPHSYGYRPGRRAHDAVRQARAYVREGRAWVVDLDLDRFFDRVNHDRLMARVARRVQDKRLLKLRVNDGKSAVAKAHRRTALGFRFLPGRAVKIRIAPEALAKAKSTIRQLTRRSRGPGISRRIQALNEYLRGWIGYFALAETPSVIEELEEWVRRRLRLCLWRQWRRVRTRYRQLRRLGIPERDVHRIANARWGPWRIAGKALGRFLGTAFWTEQGLESVGLRYCQLRETW